MLSNVINKIKRYSVSDIPVIFLAAFCFSYSLYITIKYACQVPLDLYSFRQAQTALTAYWFVKDGFSLAYETPVGGPPWSIPFEFPVYQYIVALVSQITNISLDATGRVVSFLFLVLCLIPVRAITKNLNISCSVFYIFVALLFSSPLYLYWGRTFMIETTAVFFSIAAIKYFIDIVQSRNIFKNSFLFLVFIILSILQKATTGLPVLAVLSFVYLFLNIKEINSLKSVIFGKKSLLALVYFGIPLAVGVVWVLYTDQIKILNDLGVRLTSSELREWNWGTLSQRLSSDFYVDTIWEKVFEQNLSGALGVTILMFVFFSNINTPIKSIVIISSLMGLVPLFLFPNLHIIHSYYQVANTIFLIYAIAVSLGHVSNNYFKKREFILVIVIVMVGSNYLSFYSDFLDVVRKEFNKENSRHYAVSEILKREIPQGKYFVAFGDNWSSVFSYLSERKSYTVPPWIEGYEKKSLSPEYFIEETYLGGVVVCPSGGPPTINDLTRWASANRNWKIGEVHGCYIAVPETAPVNKTSNISYTVCQGAIDFAGEVQAGKHNILSVTGWTTISGENGIVPENVYVTLVKQNSEPIYFEALQVNRWDVNVHFGQPNNAYSGFSRIINTDSFTGEYVVSIVRSNQENLEVCQFEKGISSKHASIKMKF